MEQKVLTAKEQRALEKVRRANAELAKIRRDQKKELRKAQDHHKFMMGGIIIKYFPGAYDFTEQELNRIIACAFKNRDVQNMVNTVFRERPKPVQERGETEVLDDETREEQINENHDEEVDDDES